MRFVRSASRGQSLVELALFLPMGLFLLFGIIYWSQYGVLGERTQLAVRYGGLIASNAAYSTSTIYNFLSQPNGTLPACPSPPPGVVTDSPPLPGPVSAPYLQPASVTSSCSLIVHSVGGSQFLASSIFVAALDSVSTQLAVFPYLNNVIGSSAVTVGASEPFARAADPSVILYCSQEVHDRVENAVIGALQPQPAGTPTPAPSSSPSPLTFSC